MLQKYLVLIFLATTIFCIKHVSAQDDFLNGDQIDNDFGQGENARDLLQNQQRNRGQLQNSVTQCGNLNSRIAAPKIEINQQTVSRVSGNIVGVCIVDAAFYEDGGRTQSISVNTVPTFKSFEFSISLKAGKGGKIKVHNSLGDDVEYEVENSNDQSDDPLGIGVKRGNTGAKIGGEEDTTVEPSDR